MPISARFVSISLVSTLTFAIGTRPMAERRVYPGSSAARAGAIPRAYLGEEQKLSFLIGLGVCGDHQQNRCDRCCQRNVQAEKLSAPNPESIQIEAVWVV